MDIYEEHGGKSGRIKGPFGPAFHAVVAQMPGRRRWSKDTKDLLFELTRTNLEFLKAKFPLAVWHTARVEELAAINDMENSRKLQLAAGISVIEGQLPAEALLGFPFRIPPMDHQKESFILFKDAKYFGLFWEQGLGKTKGIIDILAAKWMSGEIDTLLISAPNGVHIQWAIEALKEHLPENVPFKAYSYKATKTKKNLAAMEEVFNYKDGLRVFTVNFESTHSTNGAPFVLRVLRLGKTFWGVDESLRIKNPGAAVTKFHLKNAHLAANRSILTGTPIGRGAEDLFSQLKFLSQDILGFSSFYSFKNHYCIERPIPGAPLGAKQIVGYNNIEELREKVSLYCVRKTAAECLDIPERVYIKRLVEFTPQQKKVTEQLKKDGIGQIEAGGGVISAPEAIVRLMRYQQILSGVTIDMDGDKLQFPTNRIESAVDWVDEAASKVIIWARFQMDIDMLRDKLKKKGVCVWDGRCTSDQKLEAKTRFIEDKDSLVFLANQDAAGTGVDGLQYVCNKMGFYSNTFNAATRWQAEARLHRKGQLLPVFITDFITPGSIDAHIHTVLTLRKQIADTFIDYASIDINEVMKAPQDKFNVKEDEIAAQLYQAYMLSEDILDPIFE